ncbi:MAG: hypothetical protein ABJK59_02385 [Erythrobacter sp.]|uniref:hypothetical protein n=1 Tax=Erythrobacter sp. TaxID=1042 RepID=UPI0032981745
MEFHYGLWHGVSALYSESGRQLGEENTRPFALNHHVPAEKITCKYEGSRSGCLINVSALRTAMQNFEAALAITKAVQARHVGDQGRADPLGIWDLYILSRASIALIAYQMRFRPQAQVPNRVSDDLTSQFQFISGVFMICRHMMENADCLIAQNQPVPAKVLYDYADDNGIFISFNGMACAGSVKKIHEFLEFCIDCSPQDKSPTIALDDLVCELDNWYQYALASIELDCFIEQERAARLDQKETQTSDASTAQIYCSIGAYVRSLMPSSALTDEGLSSFKSGALLRQNRILGLLGRDMIRNLPASHIAARLG